MYHCTIYRDVSRLAQSTLDTTLESATKMTEDIDCLNDNLATSQDKLTTIELEKAKLEAKLHSALSEGKRISVEKDQALSERGEALSEKGTALTTRDNAIADRDKVASN